MNRRTWNGSIESHGARERLANKRPTFGGIGRLLALNEYGNTPESRSTRKWSQYFAMRNRLGWWSMKIRPGHRQYSQRREILNTLTRDVAPESRYQKSVAVQIKLKIRGWAS